MPMMGTALVGRASANRWRSRLRCTPSRRRRTIRQKIFVPGGEKDNASAILSKCTVVTTAIVAIVGPSSGAIAQALSPTPVYEANTTIPAKNGAAEAVHVSVHSWGIAGQEQEIPLHGFYVAHLLSGQILATVDGQTTQHLPGDYWTVKAGATMRVRVVGEVAVLETTVVSKQ
jgi:uncharacterized cupin superfamily protein